MASGSVAGSSNTPVPPAALVRGRVTISVPITGPVGLERRSTRTVTDVSVSRSASVTRKVSGAPTVPATISGTPGVPPAIGSVATTWGGSPTPRATSS